MDREAAKSWTSRSTHKDSSQTYYGDHFVMYRKTKSLMLYTRTNSVVGQLYFNDQTNSYKEKEIRFVITRGRKWEERELDKGGQKVKTSIYKTNK